MQRRTRSFAEALRTVCDDLARQIVADGEGATVVLEIAVSQRVLGERGEAIARRVATSPLVKTAAFGRDPNWGRVLAAAGSAPWNGGFAHLDPDALAVSFDGTAVYAAGAPTGSCPDALRRRLPDRARPRARRRLGRLPRQRSLDRLREAQRGVHDVSGPPSSSSAAASPPMPCATALAEVAGDVVVVHGAGPQITAEMERRGIAPVFVRGRRVTTPEVLEVVIESLARGERRGVRRGRPPGGRPARRRDRPAGTRGRGARARRRPRAVGARRRFARRSRPGSVPVVVPLAAGPLNVNADEAAAALAVGLGAERILFVSDVPGVLLDGAVATVLSADDAEAGLGRGRLRGRHRPEADGSRQRRPRRRPRLDRRHRGPA